MALFPEVRVLHHELLQRQVGAQAADFEDAERVVESADGIFAVSAAG